MTATSIEGDGISKIASLSPETKAILHQSILHYLHRSGFTKTLKRFQSEAQIQNDTWKASSANLEDIYCKYMNANCQTEDNVVESETKGKKKKKTKHDLASGDEIKETKSDALKKPADEAMNGLELNESKKNIKDKKKNKHDLAFGDEIKETKSDALKKPVDDTMNGLEVNESKKNIKDKKKNKRDLAFGDESKETKSDALKKPADGGMNSLEVNESKKNTKDKKKKNNQQEACPKENGDVDPKKSSKKRKRLLSDENGHQSDNMETDQTVEEAAKQDEVDENKEHRNEKPEINGVEKSGSQKSVKKQRIDSAEPKTINAFQRVKIDQVEFAHEKLQDNSYWAKDGADVGYGAKAQEVLGQVRGRGFRHEKTKKKRGSYRGGQIDLQSHSVKFNYSDEE